MTNLTDAELALIDAEHYPHPDGGGDCLYCCRVWPCIESRFIAELRELRAEVGNQSCVAGRSIDTCRHCSYLRRKLADARAENERLRAALEQAKADLVFIADTYGFAVPATIAQTDAALASVKETK